MLESMSSSIFQNCQHCFELYFNGTWSYDSVAFYLFDDGEHRICFSNFYTFQLFLLGLVDSLFSGTVNVWNIYIYILYPCKFKYNKIQRTWAQEITEHSGLIHSIHICSGYSFVDFVFGFHLFQHEFPNTYLISHNTTIKPAVW